MRIQPTPVGAPRVRAYVKRSRIDIDMGGVTYQLSKTEALELADAIVDTIEALPQLKENAMHDNDSEDTNYPAEWADAPERPELLEKFLPTDSETAKLAEWLADYFDDDQHARPGWLELSADPERYQNLLIGAAELLKPYLQHPLTANRLRSDALAHKQAALEKKLH
ncbi:MULTISPECIES: hypothetical protein [unclassified Rhodococcus (in: high G+C Gram-positive bacteria)]|uniref:hypothetical protein n=1 Tax=unclassified Rhodococcus (in: high G+C Gram-positive bacteria) TaxID=192944 RepID=UPI0024B64609|nr:MULTISPECIES: hypothetical protein [unclassified Rhodococcus (in: high G+C Gram-positive bacteria)]MDI9959062.1 hypothetical protein [Rhodococcus sp. IEGM 1237]MDI9964708.1 hypothetical protein [Rhodococcus sp. IEGM 1251]MDV8126675.1 hypothetical protein [Rhodococcus sp. IEGM 1304]